jgi:hypothetical protein
MLPPVNTLHFSQNNVTINDKICPTPRKNLWCGNCWKQANEEHYCTTYFGDGQMFGHTNNRAVETNFRLPEENDLQNCLAEEVSLLFWQLSEK